MPPNLTRWKVTVVNFTLSVLFVVGQSLSHVWLFATPWTVAPHQASLSFTISWSLLKLMSIESMMPSNHLILYRPLLLLPSIFPSIRVFSSESALRIRWPKHWSFRFSISPTDEYLGLIHKAVQGAFWSFLGRLGEGIGLPKLWPSTTMNLPADSPWPRLTDSPPLGRSVLLPVPPRHFLLALLSGWKMSYAERSSKLCLSPGRICCCC